MTTTDYQRRNSQTAAAIVAAGPSAAVTWPAQTTDYDTIIAVNGAVQCDWLGDYDWWSAADKPPFRIRPPKQTPRVGVITMRASMSAIPEARLPKDIAVATWDEISVPGLDGHKFEWSIVAAVAFALHRYKVNRIDLYGADWTEGYTHDCSGRKTNLHQKSSKPEDWRWDNERRLITDITKASGVEMRRITKEGIAR